jgi:O-antigen ligase
VPLLASPAFWDQFTSVKWYALQAIAVAFFLCELLVSGSRGWPWALRRAAWPVIALVALPLPGALRLGLDWAAPPLVERFAFLGLALSFFWYFRRNRLELGAARAGIGLAVVGTCVVGLSQVLGVQPFPELTAGDQRSALFGNVNMAAEFLGFALVMLLASEPRAAAAPRWALGREAMLVYAIVLLFFLASRSVFLALIVALAFLLASGRVKAARLGRLAVAAALGALVFTSVGAWTTGASSAARHLLRADVQQNKRDSSSLRFAAWGSTLALVREHPLGIGLGNFPEAFIPYHLEGAVPASEALYFRSPHNEPLKVAAEGGWAALLLALALGGALVREVWRRRESKPPEALALLGAGAAFYLVEAAFQFPSEVAAGALALSMLLGLALALVEPEVAEAATGERKRWARAVWPLAGVAGCIVFAIAGARIARSEWLFVAGPRDRASQEEACRLNPRNLPACVTAAWLQGRGGDDQAAEASLRRILLRAPHYFPAIKLLGEQALHRGDRESGCRYLWIYDEMFRRRSTVHRHLGRYCEPEQFERLRETIAVPRYSAFPFAYWK